LRLEKEFVESTYVSRYKGLPLHVND
jgi:hypothetical protein